MMILNITIFRLKAMLKLLTDIFQTHSSEKFVIFSSNTVFLFTEEKKAEKKDESESEDDDMGFGLFD